MGDSINCELGEALYFNLNKGEKIILKVVGDSGADVKSKYYLMQKRRDEVKLSKSDCGARQGCEVQVQALVDTENLIYVSGRNETATKINEQGKGYFQFQ